MADFRYEDEVLGKAYDSRLMKRLLSYAKPYWKLLVFCVLLLVAITAGELALPYIMEIAIDRHIKAYQTPMVAFSPEMAPVEGVKWQDQILVRETDLTDEYPGLPRWQLIHKRQHYYLVPTVVTPQAEWQIEQSGDGSFHLLYDGNTYPATLLSREQIGRFRQDDIASLWRLGLIAFGILAASFVLNYTQVYLLHYTGQRIIYNMRMELFSHLQKLSISFFDKNPVGRLVTRVTNDTETLNEMYTNILVNLFRDLFMLIGIVLVMLRMNTTLALIVFSVLPFIFLATFIFRKKARAAYRKVRVRLARINANFAENISGMKLVHIFRQEDKQFRQFDEINKSYLDATLGQLLVFAVFRPAMELLSALALAILIWSGGHGVLAGTVQFGVLVAFVNYVQRFFRPINDLTEKYNILQAAMASAERIFMLLDTPEEIKNPPGPKKLGRIKGRIEFKDVWFAYNPGEWVLRDLNFTINPGETVAFVGATGAGKTSIISLINRFYDIQKGQILIDGVDIRELDKYELRRQIGVVLQDVFLFTGDIKTNIRLHNDSIDNETIRRVAKYVNADHFIRALPKGYNEPVMERGATLSAGQRQLLAFARALAFEPAILVLDEATANIDTETEVLIQDALPKLIRGRTTIVIAHRLSTIQHADKIIVLHKGKIREMGNHQELLEKKGLYWDLYRLQYKEDFTDELAGEQTGQAG